ncbi:MAG: U32 family peptidase [Actinobacteria bacterium]|nr:U32 family peptidase [Actinomycetota bacterium]MCL5072081.1 U32 family peptidase [Actinomycetota bacterium]
MVIKNSPAIKKSKKLPELCVPASNLNVLKYAVAYGADAVYIGGGKYNLRTFGDNFTIGELRQSIEFAHSHNVKAYLTLNAIISEYEIEGLKDYIDEIKNIKFDAFIISDPAVMQILKQIIPSARIHISTQTSTSNSIAVNFWASRGASRINLSREVNYSDLSNIIANKNPAATEIEVFVHGALCISYSGRCMLSKYMAGRDANKGKCSHSCRWQYFLMEEKRQNMFFPIDQDKRGTYIYNSRDLCLLPKLDLIVDAGVDSLKIEGRMKTESYVSLATWVYRKALQYIKQKKFTRQKISYLMKELDKATHRNFTLGFMFLDSEQSELTENDNVGYIKNYRFIGVYEGYVKKYNGPIIKVKNQFRIGEMLDVLQPNDNPKKIRIKRMLLANTEEKIEVANPNDVVIIDDIGDVSKYSIFRIKA